ncbi:tissue inhibitor of metalloproteases [Nomia melanderi]|uniref:tissue inhibitor of metalloproteases n=1 Tax=Nomia melanderi TaxID=2448451 RepID=UPI0013044257|nr:metalloproteinase inhibitor 1-like [Nomia melanderi]XP_031841394.1 metalloproteinase inhibitor 1-like [Nomia melanderi]
MWQLTFWTYFLLVALSLAPVQRVVGCSCKLNHPQTQFCYSDYVAVVRVRREKPPVYGYHTAYNVKVNKVFKEWRNVNPVNFSRQEILWTASDDSLCGVRLNVSETYVIGGTIRMGQIHLSICGMAIPWSQVPPRQRRGFRGLYHRGCACDVAYTPWWRKGEDLENGGRKRCLWESEPGPKKCQEKYGICLARPGGCSWVPSVPYNECIKEHQRKREQQNHTKPISHNDNALGDQSERRGLLQIAHPERIKPDVPEFD